MTTFERSILQPSVDRGKEVEEAVQQQRQYWVVETCLTGDFKIENIRFIHDPEWRDGFLSIQGIRNIAEFEYERVTPRVVFWHGVQILYAIAGGTFGIGLGAAVMARAAGMAFLVVALILLALVAAGMAVGRIKTRLYWWAFEQSKRRARDERLEEEFSRSARVIAICRENMRAKRTRAAVTIAGVAYRRLPGASWSVRLQHAEFGGSGDPGRAAPRAQPSFR